MTVQEIEKLANWSAPQEVSTKHGPRLLRKSPVTDAFSDLWKTQKEEMKAAGLSFSKDRNDNWILCWWQKAAVAGQSSQDTVTALSTEQEARLAAIESKLLPYQVPSVRQQTIALQNGGALDASDTGTGKTYCALAVSIVLNRPVFVVCPKAVMPSWKRAASHFGIKLSGVCNYELLREGSTPFVQVEFQYITKIAKGKFVQKREFKSATWTLPQDTLIVYDEVHRCKDYKTLNCAVGLAALRQGYSVIGLSATAADNPTQMKFSGTLTGITTEKSFYGWMLRNGVVKGTYGLEFTGGKKALNRIHQQIFPAHGTRLRIADLGDAFPETQISAEPYSVNGAADEINRVYEEMQNELAAIEASSAKDKGTCILTAMLRARQRTETLKVPALASMVEDAVSEGLSVAVFVNFDATADALQERLKTKCTIRGNQSAETREHNIAMFQSDQAPVIICNIRAGGVGVSLHGSPSSRRRLAIICPTFSGQDLKQALGRVWRANGAKSIQRIFFAADTIEESICTQVKAKIDRIDTLNDGDLAVRGEIADVEESADIETMYHNAQSHDASPHIENKQAEPSKVAVEAKPTESLTNDQIAAIHEALRFLANRDTDRARAQNGVGFGKIDNEIGHSLAASSRLSPRQAAVGKRIVLKYRNTQLPANLIRRIQGEQ